MSGSASEERVIVVEPDEIAPGVRGVAVPVGLVREAGDRRWTVLVKAGFALPALTLAATQPLRLDASDFADGEPAERPEPATLPSLAPRVALSALDGREQVVAMACDRLDRDADRELAFVLWRGVIAMNPASAMATRWIAVSLERPPARAPEVLARSMVRGLFTYAAEEEDLGAEPSAADGDRLRLARQQLWSDLWMREDTDPTLSLDDYARLSAALAEGRDREGVLARAGLNEEHWSIEEQGWLMKMARDASEGGGALAVAYGERFVAAQDTLGRPEEEGVSLDDYAAIRDAVESSEDPAATLRAWAMTLPMWMRLHRRMTIAGRSDPAIGAEIRQRRRALRAERKREG